MEATPLAAHPRCRPRTRGANSLCLSSRDSNLNESQRLERKSSGRDGYLKWLSGFANAKDGVLVIGRNDRGRIVGVKDPLRWLEEIPNKSQSLLGIAVDVDPESEAGREYLAIKVEPHPNPISYKGEYHYRSGSTRQILRGADRVSNRRSRM